MPAGAYRALIAATNMKQRVRKLIEYTWADRLGYAVIGTPNLLEYDQGFFVKGGDGAGRRQADRAPLQDAGLRARPRSSACRRGSPARAPTTETFSLPQTQEEFYFGHPLRADGRAAVGARPRTSARATLAPPVGLAAEDVEAAYREIERRRVATAYLHAPAVLVEPEPTDDVRHRRASSGAAAAQPVDEDALRRMARAIRHRGPDGFGLRARPGRRAGLHAAGDLRPAGRLAADRAARDGDAARLQRRGLQPPRAARASSSARRALRDARRDTEVVLRLLEREGLAALRRAQRPVRASPGGSRGARRLTLVRDRFGVRPLHYALLGDGTLVFGSEAKALFASGEVDRRARPARASTRSSRCGDRARRAPPFAASRQLPPGRLLVWERGRDRRASAAGGEPGLRRPTARAGAATLRAELLRDSVRLRLRADVPVGTYLSGGLDSSLITALAQQASDHELRTFSVAFHDPRYDERAYQEQVARGARHAPPRRRDRARARSPTASRTSSGTPRRR